MHANLNMLFNTECIDCVAEWSEWGECTNNERIRNQYVLQDAVGAGKQCDELQRQAEGKPNIYIPLFIISFNRIIPFNYEVCLSYNVILDIYCNNTNWWRKDLINENKSRIE